MTADRPSPRRERLSAEEALRIAGGAPGSTGFFFDFDGVLAPIQADPAAVRPTPGVVERLADLVRLTARVGVISARPVSFLRDRLGGVPGLSLYGLYGLESARNGAEIAVDPEAEPWIPAVRQAVDRAHRELPSDVLVEDKHLAVALHYRTAPHHAREVAGWAAAVTAELGLAVQEGRMVVELKPPVARDKGTTIRREIGDLDGAWYFGDDVSDARAFQALADREAERRGFVGVRVAVANDETGQALKDLADFVLDSPAATPAFLGDVVARLT
ncbi:trehalose-phosphatase [Thermoactinospora rubra]|uniref:trehalose-phosphatase n=1 Tax=Thermoactinospora rubra TaxID=1088767 RepID=UPI000A119772|nr:trehalose-phosphatase [Thermoactinospora rubra]